MNLHLFGLRECLHLVLTFLLAVPTLFAAELPPAEKSYEETLKQQELLQRLRWQVEASETKAKDYRAKAEMARALSEALKTGLVDSNGNIVEGGPAAPTFVPPDKAALGGETGAQVASPTLASIQGKWAYFSTSKGLLRAQIGTMLPGDFRLKAIKPGHVVLEQQGTEYIAKLNWTKFRKTKASGVQPRSGVPSTLDLLNLPLGGALPEEGLGTSPPEEGEKVISPTGGELRIE